MVKNKTTMNKGGGDLVKNSSLMVLIDNDAEIDHKHHEVGGSAYESTYIDNMSVAQVMSVNKADKKQQLEDDVIHPGLWLTLAGIVLVGIAVVLILLL